MSDTIVLDKVVKVFQEGHHEQILAVDHLTLEIRRGEIFSFVGPDGAGKTTTIRMMCGVLPATEGKISIFGYDIRADREEVKKRIGYLSQRFSLYQDLTIDENLDFFAEIHRIKKFQAQKEELLQFTRLTEFRDRLAGKLSGGMKQKLALACTLIHSPELILLDEPTTGVDPVSRRDFWKILSSLLKQGITIVASTPYLDEAERSTRVALMNEGRLLQCDTPEQIKNDFPHRVFEIVCRDVHQAVAVLSTLFKKSELQLFGDRLHLLVTNKSQVDAAVIAMEEHSLPVEHVREITPSLEDVFIARIQS
ncbi:MAG: ABC transporter ATP-binding protein [bacterium]